MEKPMTVWDRVSLSVKAFALGLLSGAIVSLLLASYGCATVGGALGGAVQDLRAATQTANQAVENK